MDFIKITDDEINHYISKLIIEYAYIVGSDKFSVDFKNTQSDIATQFQYKLLISLNRYYLGEQLAPVEVIRDDQSNIQLQKFWSLNHDSIAVILNNIGRHLLDDMLAYNEGVSGWRFYKENKIVACAVYGYDYLYFIDPPSELIEKLSSQTILRNT